MTINLADNSPRISYAVAQGATQTSFAVPFEFFASTDLNVYVDGTLKTLTTHYTVSGGDGSTGTVTISVTGATGGSTVVITRDVALERTSDFPSSGPFQIGALNTELDRLTAIAADLDDKAGRALQLTDFDVAASLVLPTVDNRKGKTLAFNASSGAVEAGPTISDVQTVSAAAADIQTLAHIEDGTDATDAIQTVAGIASNVSTVAGVSSAVSTVAGISSNVTAVAADATDIGAVAGKATEIGRLGTSDAVADLAILGTSDAVSDMNTLAAISSNISTVAGISANVTSVAGVASLITSDFVADLNTLATSDIVSDLNTLATADIVSDLNTLATSDIVSDLNTLATADIVSDLNTLATTDIVSDLNTLATTDIVTDLNLLATSAIVEDLNLLATSTVIADMATLAGAGANPNISSLGVSGNITFADNGKAIFGAGSDLQIYHDGSHSYISDQGEGRLRLAASDKIQFYNAAVTEKYAEFTASGAAELRYANAIKFATSSTGVDITGTLVSDGLTVDGTATTRDDASTTSYYSTDVASNVVTHTSNGTGAFAQEVWRLNDGGTPSERMRLTTTGLGIGTSSPSQLLTVGNTSTQYTRLQFYAATNGASTIHFGDGTSGVDNYRGYLNYAHDSNSMQFATNGTERMRLDASGNLLVGKTSTGISAAGHTFFNNGEAFHTRAGTPMYLNRTGSDGSIVNFYKDGAPVGSIGVGGSSAQPIIGSGNTSSGGTAAGLRFDRANNAIEPWNVITNASADNIIDLGFSSIRFQDIYATNGTIQTSDRNEKQDIAELSEAEQRVAVAAKGLLRKFRWKSAVEAKADEARTHFGIIAQDLQAAFAAEGLDAGDYAMFISSTWTDEDTGEERTRMGVRYSELLAFIIAAI